MYWYWQNGNITNEGLTKDLEWMHRVGVGGVETFDVAVTTPDVVNPRLLYMTPAWKDAFHHSLQLTDKLGMEVTILRLPASPKVRPSGSSRVLRQSRLVLHPATPVNRTIA